MLSKQLSSGSNPFKKPEIKGLLAGAETKKGSALTERLEEKRYNLNGFSVSSQSKIKNNIGSQPLISPTKDQKYFSKIGQLGAGSKPLTDRVSQSRQSSQPPKAIADNIFRERRESPHKSGSLIRQTPAVQKPPIFPNNPTTTPLGQSRLDGAQWNPEYNLPKTNGPQMPLALQQSKASGSVSTDILNRLGKSSQNPQYQKKRSSEMVLQSDEKIFSTFGGILAEQSSPKAKDKKIRIPNEVDKVLANQQYVSLVKPSHEKISSQLSESHERTVHSSGSKVEAFPSTADRERLQSLRETNDCLEILGYELERCRLSGKRLSKEEYNNLKSAVLSGKKPSIQETDHLGTSDPSADFLRLRLENLEAHCASLNTTLQELQTAF